MTLWTPLLLAGALVIGGCAPKQGTPVLTAIPFVTEKTGQLTIERQDFINTWASAQVLYDAWMAHEQTVCKGSCGDPQRCARLPELSEQAKLLTLTVEAKLRNPEAAIDWGNVVKLLSLIAKVVL